MPAAIPLDNQAILALHEAGKSTRDIATILPGVHWTTIARRLKHLTPRKTTQIYRELRADVLTEMQRKLLMQCYNAKPREARDLAAAFAIYYDRERLERGMSTSNTSVQVGMNSSLQASLDALVKRVPDVVEASECAISAQQDQESNSTAK